ncbi:MAG: tetratricopeptide repeat protein [Gemmatimonadales bacterium]|nr:tetratricopeptide repeat protein [Gemmatimonadales bacterium]
MSDDIRTLTTRLAEEPSSLAFLELAESLRQRGKLDAAYKVARGGLGRYPGLADAHDLMARILSDRGDLAGAFDAWSDALRLDPLRTGALKGIAFLYFRAGDVAAAIAHLERASEADPDDPSIHQALARVRRESTAAAPPPDTAPAPAPISPPAAPAPDSPFTAGVEDERGVLLVDANGMRLAGELSADDGSEAGDRVAAQLAGVSREAARATRLLGLGTWQSIAVESPGAHLILTAPTSETVLLVTRDASFPMARVGLIADRAARTARSWLEQVG